MAVSDGVFDEGTFDNATFNNINRSENLDSVDDTARQSELLRSFNGALGADEGSVEVEHGFFQTPSNNSTITEDLGVKADVVEFRVTSTNPTLNSGSKVSGGDFGWGHGYAAFQDNGIDEFALSHGSGSASTNGHFSESTSNHSIFQIVTDNSGDVLEGKIRGSVTRRTGTEIDINFEQTQEQQYVFYTAYSYTYDDIEVGFFQAENTNTTQSITSPDFKPNFLRLITTPNLETMDTTVNELSNGTADLGWGQGVAVENSSGIKQGSLAVSQFSSNIDGHAYTSSDSDVLSIAYMTNKQSLNGETKASATFTSNGFDLTYNTTTNPNNETPVVLYLAANTLSEPDASFETTPTSTGKVEYSTDVGLGNLLFISSNTVPFFDDGSGVGRKTWGWNYGTSDFASQESIGFSSNSDSVNGHHFENRTDFAYNQLYTDPNGNLIGRDRASVAGRTGESFTLDWTQVTTTSDGGDVISDSVAFIWYGFSRTSQVGGEQVSRFNKSLTQPFSLLDTLDDTGQFFRNVSDNTSLNDFASLDAELFRNLIASTSFSDDSSTFVSKPFSENVTIEPNLSSDASLFRLFDETFVIDDFEANEANLFRGLIASTLLSDSDIQQVQRTLGETYIGSDNVNRDAELFRDVTEFSSLDDTEKSLLLKPLLEDVQTSDVSKKSIAKPLSQTSSFNDDVNSTSQLFRSLSFNINILDNQEELSLVKNLQESSQVSDIFKKQFLKNLTENLITQEELLRSSDLKRVLNESVGLVDNNRSIIIVRRVFQEALGVSDAEEQRLFKSVSQKTELSENVKTEAELLRALQESFDLTEVEAVLFNKQLPENLSVNDKKELLILARIADSAGIADEANTSADLFRGLSEVYNISDSDIRELSRTVSQSVDSNSSIQRDAKLFRQLAEDIIGSDITEKTLAKKLLEVLISDDKQRTSLLRGLSEPVLLNESLEKIISRLVTARTEINDVRDLSVLIENLESLATEDRLETLAKLFRQLNANLQLSDSDIQQVAKVLDITVSPGDTFEKEADLFRQVSQSLLIDDATSKKVFRFIVEAISVSDSVETQAELFRNVSAQISTSVIINRSILKSLTESPLVNTELLKKIKKPLSQEMFVEDIFTSFEPAQELATDVEIDKLQKAVTRITAARKAVAELEKKYLLEGELDKF